MEAANGRIGKGLERTEKQAKETPNGRSGQGSTEQRGRGEEAAKGAGPEAKPALAGRIGLAPEIRCPLLFLP